MKIVFGPTYLLIVLILALHLYLGVFPSDFVMWVAIYLIVKGILFSIAKQRLLSLLDMVCGVYFLIILLRIIPNTFVTLLPLIYLAEKGASYTWVGLRA